MKLKATVSIIKSDLQNVLPDFSESEYEIVRSMVLESLDLIGGLDKLIGDAKNVVIKPNLVEIPFGTTGGSVITDPRVLSAIVSLLKEHGVTKVIVAEGKSVNLKHIKSSPRQAFETSGLAKVVERAGGEILGWDEEPFITVDVPNGEIFDKIDIPKSILEADLFINVPKLKTHCQTEITVGIKSMQGVFGVEDKLKHHTEAFPWKMVDILRVVKPHLTIVDGLICGEGYGPIYTDPVEMNLIVSSEDVVAIDAVCSAIMGIEPNEVPITRLAHSEGIGIGTLDRIEVKGESIADVMKHFKRSAIWNPIGCSDKIRIFAGDACRFTLAQVGAAVRRLQLEGLIDDLEDICVIVGHNAPVPVRKYKHVYIIGDSAMDTPIEGTFIPGSPPLPSVQIVNKFKQHLKTKKNGTKSVGKEHPNSYIGTGCS
jgi:uncharacterized protein (DUF362 family)